MFAKCTVTAVRRAGADGRWRAVRGSEWRRRAGRAAVAVRTEGADAGRAAVVPAVAPGSVAVAVRRQTRGGAAVGRHAERRGADEHPAQSESSHQWFRFQKVQNVHQACSCPA